MDFSIVTESPREAQKILGIVSGKAGLAEVPSAIVTLAGTLSGTVYLTYEDGQWGAQSTPGVQEFTLAAFVDRFQGEVEVDSSETAWLKLSTEFGEVTVNPLYQVLHYKGLVNSEALVVRALELLLDGAGAVELTPHNSLQSRLLIDGKLVAVRRGDVAEAREFLIDTSVKFREFLI